MAATDFESIHPPDVNYDEVDTALKAADTEHVLFEGEPEGGGVGWGRMRVDPPICELDSNNGPWRPRRSRVGVAAMHSGSAVWAGMSCSGAE